MSTHKTRRCNKRKTRKSSTWVNMLSLLNMQDASCVLHQSNASNRSMYTQHWASCQKSERPLCIRNSHQLVRKNYMEPLHSEITGTSCLTESALSSCSRQRLIVMSFTDPCTPPDKLREERRGDGKRCLIIARIYNELCFIIYAK